MIITVDVAEKRPALHLIDPENFRDLKAVISHASVEAFPTSPIGRTLGRWDGTDHVWVDRELLIRLAEQSTDTGEPWSEGFQQMLTYAEKSGWVDREGLVRVHVEYSSG